MPLTFDQYKALRMKGLTDDDIRKAESSGTVAKVLEPTPTSGGDGGFIGNTIKNIPSSAGNFLSGIGQALLHPIETVKGVGTIALGGAQKFIPGEQEAEQTFDAVTTFFKDRYGGLDNIKNTVESDPIGFLSDVATLFTGGGALATKVGTVGKLSEFASIANKAERIAAITKAAKAGELGDLAKLGTTLKTVGATVDPVGVALKGVGRAAELATEGKNLGFFKGSVDEEAVRLAREQGIDLPASALSKSPAVKALEAIAGKGLFGSKMVKFVEEAGNKLQDLANNIVGKSASAEDVGGAIVEGMGDYKNAFLKTKEQLYKAAKIDANVKVPETIMTITSIIKRELSASKALGKPTELLGKLKSLKKGLSSRNLTANDVFQAMRKLNEESFKKISQVVTGDPAVARKIAATLDEETSKILQKANPKAFKAHEVANEFYKEHIKILNSAFSTKIAKFAETGQPSKIVDDVILKGAFAQEDVPKLFKILEDNKPGAVDQIRSYVADQIFQKAGMENGKINPGRLGQAIKSVGENKLKAILGEEKFASLKTVQKLAEKIQTGTKIAEGSQTAFIGRMIAEIGLLASNPFNVAIALVGDAAMSKFLGSKAGIKFLTSGIELTGETGRKIQRIAPKVAGRARKAFQAGRADQIINE